MCVYISELSLMSSNWTVVVLLTKMERTKEERDAEESDFFCVRVGKKILLDTTIRSSFDDYHSCVV